MCVADKGIYNAYYSIVTFLGPMMISERVGQIVRVGTKTMHVLEVAHLTWSDT